jgi:NodT family efflux transporter outer membrane factor (OMF) lipoprotein
MKRPMTLRIPALAIVSSLLVCGCISPYARPDLVLPDRFAHAAAQEQVVEAVDPWWRAVGDPGLDAVIAQSLAANRDLAAAGLRVRRARLLAGLTALDQWPTASASLSGVQTRSASSFSANLSVAYDLDLWRRLASATSAARWEALATDEDRQATRLVLTGTVARLYWDMGFTRQQIAIGQATLKDQQKIHQIVTAQHSLGAISGVELAEAQQALSLQTTALSVLAQHLVEDEAALAILWGNQGSSLGIGPADLTGQTLPDVRAGAPVELLSRRPDLKAAEMRLRATLATGDATRASLYPDLVLTAAGGAVSPALGKLLDHPVGSLTGLVSFPFLDLPRHRLNNKVARADYEIAVIGFKTALFQALSDTDNALSNRTELIAQEASLTETLKAARIAERLYGIRYRTGLAPLRLWLEAQQNARSAQLALDGNRLAQLNNYAALSLALGGGTGIRP